MSFQFARIKIGVCACTVPLYQKLQLFEISFLKCCGPILRTLQAEPGSTEAHPQVEDPSREKMSKMNTIQTLEPKILQAFLCTSLQSLVSLAGSVSWIIVRKVSN